MGINSVIEKAKSAKEAAIKLAVIDKETKNRVLGGISRAIDKNRKSILKENNKDVKYAEKNKLSPVIIKRLQLDDIKIDEIIKEVEGVRALEDPVGKTINAVELDNGLELYQVTCPIGVIGAIFESRPDALVQIACLCFKAGNAVMLKGGSEALYSNRILADIISRITDKAANGCVQLIEGREEVKEILKADKYIDLIIPRGSAAFVGYIQEHSRIPVLGHSEGICHIYVDKEADINKALDVCFDAKCQYPAVCNAMETLLVHRDIADRFLPLMAKKYKEAHVELRGDEASREISKEIVKMKRATEDDWGAEYNDLILSVRVVRDADEAIGHINKFGSRHTDGIITEDEKTARRFMNLVDSSSVMWNCSTRFADGYRYGKGAEVGISTAKIHARGPVGLEGLVIYKYMLVGNGHVVRDYTGKNPKPYMHKKLDKKW